VAAAAAASATVGAGAAAEGAEQAARAEAMGAIAPDGWRMGSASRRERRALAAEAAVAPPLHMAAEGTTTRPERLGNIDLLQN
jgi:hypothetical protein